MRRVFMIKCPNAQLLHESRRRGVWGVNAALAETLGAAMQRDDGVDGADAGRGSGGAAGNESTSEGGVRLVFSIAMSGHFQGYADVAGEAVLQTTMAGLDHTIPVRHCYAADLNFDECR